MKNLNRKGFTLIELLAVIVVLAIVLVVTIPAVLSSMQTARQKQFNNMVAAIEEYTKKQIEACKVGNMDLVKYDDDIFLPDTCNINSKESAMILDYAGGYTLYDPSSDEGSDYYSENYENPWNDSNNTADFCKIYITPEGTVALAISPEGSKFNKQCFATDAIEGDKCNGVID